MQGVNGYRVVPPQNWQHNHPQYGLTASYVLTFALAQQRGLQEPFIVFEDDAVMAPGWHEYLAEAMKEAAQFDWVFLNLGADVGRDGMAPPVPVTPRLARMTHGWRLHAVVYNHRKIADLIALMMMHQFTGDQVWNHLMTDHNWEGFYMTRSLLAGTRGGVSQLTGINWEGDWHGPCGLGGPAHEVLR